MSSKLEIKPQPDWYKSSVPFICYSYPDVEDELLVEAYTETSATVTNGEVAGYTPGTG